MRLGHFKQACVTLSLVWECPVPVDNNSAGAQIEPMTSITGIPYTTDK